MCWYLQLEYPLHFGVCALEQLHPDLLEPSPFNDQSRQSPGTTPSRDYTCPQETTQQEFLLEPEVFSSASNVPLLGKLSCDLCVVVNEEEWHTTTMTDLKQCLILSCHTNAFSRNETECDQVVGKYLCCLIQIVQKGLFVSV